MVDQVSQGRLSPFLQRQRIAATRPHLRGRVLDFGCGSGALAAFVNADQYLGIDVSEESLRVARAAYPYHQFQQGDPSEDETFETVVALAVIEHVRDPSVFLTFLAAYLVNADHARIVLTTPHPSLDWAHGLGAKIGLFSQAANDEHEELLDRRLLADVGQAAGLRLYFYSRFLFGANQIATFAKER